MVLDCFLKKTSKKVKVLDVEGIINKFLGVKNDIFGKNVVFLSSSGC